MTTIRRITLFLMLSGFAFGQGAQFPKYTVATLPAASSHPTSIVEVIDGTSGTDCTAGGGSTLVLCKSNAGSWTAIAGGGSGTIQSSPQFQLCYFDLVGTNAHCKGDTGFTTDGSGNLKAASVNAQSISNVVYASQFSGADAGAKIAAAMAAVSNNGTVVADFQGAQTMSVDPFSGVNKSVTLKFTGCATYTLTSGLSANGTYRQVIKGAGQACTIFEDGAASISLINEFGAAIASDFSLTYNSHASVVAVELHSGAILTRVTINGGFPTYGISVQGGVGTGVFTLHVTDVTINGTGTAPQYGVAEISSPPGYVGLNEYENLTVNGTSVAGMYLDGGDTGGPTLCINCYIGGNSGLGLWVEDAIAQVYNSDCEGNTGGNVYVNPNPAQPFLNAGSAIYCQSAADIYNSIVTTGTIANASNSLSVANATGINPGVVLGVTGATFSGTSSYYERVTAVSGTTITLASATTVSGGSSGANVFGPVTPQWLQNAGAPASYSTEYFTEQQKYYESPFVRRGILEGLTYLRPEINTPSYSRWLMCGGTGSNACTSAMTNWYIYDNAASAIIANFDAANHEFWVGSGGYGISGCCTVITGGGDVNAHGVIEVQGNQVIDNARNVLPNSYGQAGASQIGGTCAMAASTSCTISIVHTYTTPVCIATQQSGTLTGGAVGCTVSGTTVTITAAVANSETWGAFVFGNPN